MAFDWKDFENCYYTTSDDALKQAWKRGYEEGRQSLIFRSGDEVEDKISLRTAVVLNDVDNPRVLIMYDDGSVTSFERDEAHEFIEKTGTAYSEIPILREKLKYSFGNEFGGDF